MGFEELEYLEQVNSIFTLIFVIISILLGVRILLKYFSLKRKELLTIGFAWIFLTSAWWGGIYAFMSISFFNQQPSTYIFLFLSNIFVPLALICWIFSLVHIFYQEKEKTIITIVILIYLSYDILIIALLSIRTELVGTIEGNINSKPTIIPLLFLFSAIITTIFTGLLFSIKSIKVDDPEIKLKGVILLIGFLSFSAAGIMDSLIADELPLLIIARLILISSAIEYYLGFFLPKKISNRLKK